MKKKFLLLFVICLSFASGVFAHKPELVSEYSSKQILVEKPEVSKAYMECLTLLCVRKSL